MNFRKPTDWAGIIPGLWFIFWPKPYIVLLVACGLAPLIAIAWAAACSDVTLTESADPDDTSLLALWMPPSLGLALRSLGDANTIDWKAPLISGAVLAGAVATVMWRLDRRGDRGAVNLIVMTAVLFGWGWGVLSLINSKLDPSAGLSARAAVLQKRPTSRGPDDLTLQIFWPVLHRIKYVEVSQALFDRVQVGSVLDVKVHEGLLGWRHLKISRSQPDLERSAQPFSSDACPSFRTDDCGLHRY